MEDLGSDVAAEEALGWAVPGGAAVVLVAVEDFSGGESGRAVGEYGAVVDEGLVGKVMVGDEDGGAGADAERDNGAEVGA